MGHNSCLILTASSGLGGINDIVAISSPNHKCYADKHGYEYRIDTECFCTDRPAPWSKVSAAQKHLPHYDFVFWIDTDCLVSNFDVKVEDLLKGYDMCTSFFKIGEGYHGYPYNLHTGCWPLRNTAWTNAFLKEIYDQEDVQQGGDYEEAVITKKYRESKLVRSKIKVMKLSNLCSPYWLYRKDDFVIHFCRLVHDKKIQYMNDFLAGTKEFILEDKNIVKVF